MKFASLLIKSGLTVAGAGLYLLFKRFFRKVKKTTEKTIEKVETKLEKKSTTEPPQESVNVPVTFV